MCKKSPLKFEVQECNVTISVATINTLAFGGNGVCRIDGKVCFVPFSCPGDEVSLRITSQKKSYCTASIAEIITPSSSRTVPVCAIFGECGGCNWQHISYPAQLEHKRNILAEALWRGARVPQNLIDDVVGGSRAGHCKYLPVDVLMTNFGSFLERRPARAPRVGVKS